MAYNLSRNSRVFVTTNVSTATGAVLTAGFAATNTWELQVLDGFSFKQDPANTTISINEAGTTPIRGSRSFNTALNPVDLTFSTYTRPKLSGTVIAAEEKVLWNALLGYVGIEGTTNGAGTTVTAVTLGGTPATTLVRATTSSPVVTFGGTSLNSSNLTVGSTYNITGLSGTGSAAYNRPVKVNSASTTAIVVEYLTPPANEATTIVAAVTASAGVKFSQGAWFEQPTAAGITPYSMATSAHSNKNQLQAIGFIFNVDNAWYTVDNSAVDQVSLDFGLDAIAMCAWTVKGTKLNTIAAPTTITAKDTAANSTGTFGGGTLTGTFNGVSTTAGYITNKLSTVTLKSTLGGVGSGALFYNLVLTGGNLTIANNINYVTPSNIGTVNVPIGYFTGNRAVSGTLNAYMRTGTATDDGTSTKPYQVAKLLDTMLSNIASAAETKYKLQIEIGGSNSGVKVEAEMPGVVLGIPSVDIQDVVSTAITFNAQGTSTDLNGTTAASYDLENTNDISVRYFSNV